MALRGKTIRLSRHTECTTYGLPAWFQTRGYNEMLIEYRLLTHLSEIQAIASQWDELLGRSCCNRAFSSVTWYVAACRAQPHLIPCVSIALRGLDLAGVLPLALNPATGDAIFPSEMSSYNDLIVDPSDEAVAASLLHFAVSNPKPYGRLDLLWVRNSSKLLRAARSIEESLNCCFHSERDYSFIRLPRTYEKYLESRSRLFRRNLRRARRIAEADGFTVQRLNPATFPAERIPELFLAFHLARFGNASSFRKRPENLVFAQMALPELFVRGQIIVPALFRGTEIVGIDINLAGYDSLCAWNGGYPPDIEPWSPGRLLVDEAIRLAFQRGCQEYDLLRGTQEWKKRWTNELRKVGSIEIVPGSPKVQATVS
jgi:CelD/BcsL family acetyltransferase involved in cellulose biosynthesis